MEQVSDYLQFIVKLLTNGKIISVGLARDKYKVYTSKQ